MLDTTLKTEHLILSPLTQKDAEFMFPIWANTEVTHFMDIDPFKEIKQAQDMIALFQQLILSDSAVRYKITYNNHIIGSAGYNEFTITNSGKSVEVGYELAKKYWRKGFGTELLNALCSYVFETLNCTEVTANIAPGNKASQNLVKKLNFKLISTDSEGDYIFSNIRK
ncbi:GNAT family N-acetyltransferase [Dellaglioa sp. P0083]|uniref:GNAT family N-acetyltransferase n=1 Tax=Dellaglioa kimchii TaxID=3344667 RepID=UPI0038D4DB08